MKFRNLIKKIAAYVCIGAMVISSTVGAGAITASAEEAQQSKEDIFVDGAVYDYGEVSGYAYHYGWLCEATSEYKYMFITYTGDITNLRLEFQKVGTDERWDKVFWMDQAKEDAIDDQGRLNTKATLAGEPILTSETGATVVIDLEASGINLDNLAAMDMHYGPGTLDIGYVRLSTSSEIKDVDVMPEKPEVPEKLEPITLTGLIGVWTPKPEDVGYSYLTGAEVNAKAGYKYLELTYKGDETAFDALRFEFEGTGSTLWFRENAEGTLKTVDGELVPAPTEEEQTVVIDLEASGMDITKAIAKIHMHQTPGNGSFEITNAVLSGPESNEPTKPEKLEPMDVTGLIGVWTPKPEDVGYSYLTGAEVNAKAGYKYLELTYKGDETAFDALRFEFEGTGSTLWFRENAEGTLKTVDGELVPAPTEEEQTVVIDLEASGMDITKAIAKIHMHQTPGNGSFEITNAKLLAEYTASVDPNTAEDIILNGDENGLSSMIKSWTVKGVAAGGDQYKYLGFVTLKEPTSVYKYLILTYAGDIGSIRFEFAAVDETGETAKSAPYWFNKEGQELYFVTADGSDIPLDGGKGTTIVIDLEKSGVDLDKYNSIHMQSGYGIGENNINDFSLKIGMARLSAKPDIASIDAMPPEQPITTKAPVTTAKAPEETTTKAPEETTTKVPNKVKKPAKATISKVNSKKKSAKKVKLSLKKVKNAKGYQVQFSTTKKFKKVLVKKYVKKVSVTINSKKLKNKKKLYVRARAYVLDGKTKVFGKYSKVKKVKIKK